MKNESHCCQNQHSVDPSLPVNVSFADIRHRDLRFCYLACHLSQLVTPIRHFFGNCRFRLPAASQQFIWPVSLRPEISADAEINVSDALGRFHGMANQSTLRSHMTELWETWSPCAQPVRIVANSATRCYATDSYFPNTIRPALVCSILVTVMLTSFPI